MLAFGRRPCIAFNSIFFITGPVLMAAAESAVLLSIGRFVIGLGIGISAVVVPAYLGVRQSLNVFSSDLSFLILLIFFNYK